MEEVNSVGAPHQFSCSFCLDLLKDPVSLPCGHQICRMCTAGCWHQDDQKKVYSCTQCKLQSFSPRHAMNKTALNDVVETLMKTTLQAAPPAFSDSFSMTQDTVSTAARQAEKQLLQMQNKYKEIIQNRENELQKLRTAVGSYKEYVQTVIQEGDRIFKEFIKSIERKHEELTFLIRSQAEAAVSRADEIIKEMNQEIAELRRKDTQMQELLHSENPLNFLQSFQFVSAAHGFTDSRTINYSSSLAFGNVLKSLSEMRNQLETYINNEFKKISNQDVLFSFAPDSPSSSTFADLIKSSGGISFIKKEPSLSLDNASMAVFGATASQNNQEDHEDSVEDIYLSNLTLESDRADGEVEKIIFKQEVNMMKWDDGVGQWKELGVGDLKILFHPVKKYYRVLMMCDTTLKECVNHIISKDIDMKPLNSSVETVIWMANDCTEDNAKEEPLAARFKTPECAQSFRKIFTDCQRVI